MPRLISVFAGRTYHFVGFVMRRLKWSFSRTQLLAGWLGWAMVLGSFQCRGVLLLLHIVGQGPAVLAAGAGWVGYIVFIFFIYFTFLMSCLLGDGWTWLKYCSFGCETPTVVVSYCWGRPRLVLVNRLEGLSLPRNSTTINWPARHDLVVDWAVKPQHKQTKNNF